MRHFLIITSFLLLSIRVYAQPSSSQEIAAWNKQAKQVTIIRDTWGVPHIYGKTDADVVFALMYAQCEDNYWMMEETALTLTGRLAEVYGEKALAKDATAALYESVKLAKEAYATAEPEFRKLCLAAASGINYYLHKHPEVERRLIQRYEPWHFLISGTANPASHGITSAEMQKAYHTGQRVKIEESFGEWFAELEKGSNSIAIAPSKSKTKNPLLLINPHVSLFGLGQRYEAHLVSEEGLNASGFAFFGQFYIWVGFTSSTAWAHTATASDYSDVYLETFDHPTDSLLYKYGNEYRKAVNWYDTLYYNTSEGIKSKVYHFKKTHHGPVVGKRNHQFVTIRDAEDHSHQHSLQAWRMSKARNLHEFKEALSLVQITGNTMYADNKGNIVYWHGNAVPKRDPSFDWMNPVDGSNPQTDWKGMHSLDELIQVANPASGWLQNCNSSPYLAAGSKTNIQGTFPNYMAYDPHTFRAKEAVRLLEEKNKFTLDDLATIANSPRISMMAAWLPSILAAYDKEVKKYPEKLEPIRDAIDTLRQWNYRYSEQSKATSLASSWAYHYFEWVWKTKGPRNRYFIPELKPYLHDDAFPISDSLAVHFLMQSTSFLEERFGTYQIAWGEVSRLQRIHPSGTQETFSDDKPSVALAPVDGAMGSLFSVNHRVDRNTKKLYATGGNSYVGVIEVGKKIRARSIVNFGQSADPASPHYFDQGPLFARGQLKEAWFYKEDVLKHAERTYHPGE